MLLRGLRILPEPGGLTWALLWLWRLLRWRRAVLVFEGLAVRANCGGWPASDETVVTSERAAIEGEVTIAEELTGFHKLAGWDLEPRRSLPEKVQDAGTDCREPSAMRSPVERRPCVSRVEVCIEELSAALWVAVAENLGWSMMIGRRSSVL